jgi:hypothetical protein
MIRSTNISSLIDCPVLANTTIDQEEVWCAMEWNFSCNGYPASQKLNDGPVALRNTFRSVWNALARGQAPDWRVWKST